MVDLIAEQEGDRVVIKLDPGEPVELDGLSDSFAALARLYARHYRNAGEEAPRLYVTRIETGSVLLEVAPMALVMGMLVAADNAVIVADFTNRLWRGIKAFSGATKDAPRVEPPPREDTADIREFVRPLVGKPEARLGIKHARYERTDGERTTVLEYTLDEGELNRAAINMDKALALPPPEQPKPEPNETIRREVMLFMYQANRGPGKEAGRTGDKAIVPEVSDKPLPVYFRKSFENLKERLARQTNPMTSTCVVDVHVQMVEGEPKGYIVTDVHQVMEDGDDGE